MTRRHFTHIISIMSILLLLLTQATHCSKDYSYEGGPENDTLPNRDTTAGIVDTIHSATLLLPTCTFCTKVEELKPNTWMFTLNGTVICGQVTNAVKSVEGTALTFFGPSACSKDTGLIITAYFDLPGLSISAVNQYAQRAAFEYYDNITPSKIAETLFTEPFTLLIARYNQQSGEATGTFKGEAHTAKGELINITEGRFNITFK